MQIIFLKIAHQFVLSLQIPCVSYLFYIKQTFL